MDYEDQQPHDHEGGDMQQMGPSYDSLSNNNTNSAFTRPSKLPTSPVALDVEPQSQRKPRYRECLKNHAVSIGSQAVDGCGEFLPAGAEGTLDALKCAACSCHRNFHRKETYPVVHGGVVMDPYQLHHHQNPPPPPLLTHYPHSHHQQFTPPYYHRSMASSSPTGQGYLQVGPPQHQQQLQRPPPLALPSNSGGGGGGSGGAGGEEGMNSGGEGGWGSKKRFRTKFTAEQKERMVGFANRLGWRIQKQDEETVQQFCRENGLKRHVLKVWMHNNKHTIGMGKLEEVKKD